MPCAKCRPFWLGSSVLSCPIRNIFVRGISPASGITAERFVVWRSANTDRTACRGLLFTWINCVRSMNKYLHAQQSAEWNYLSISKVKRLQRWSLGMDKWFHPTLYNLNGSNYLSMLGSKLIHYWIFFAVIFKWLVFVSTRHYVGILTSDKPFIRWNYTSLRQVLDHWYGYILIPVWIPAWIVKCLRKCGMTLLMHSQTSTA